VNGVLADSTADTGSGRRQRLLPLLRAGLAGGAGAPLPNNSMTMRLAVDAVSAATRITVRPLALPQKPTCCRRCSIAIAPTVCRRILQFVLLTRVEHHSRGVCLLGRV